tara:strand:+ start:452 stop:631 length:180 start_codon:yes stop_codon:yes gene_type:complete
MKILTQIPLGSKLKVKNSGKIVTLNKIAYYPTRYETLDDNSHVEYYRTHEVDIIDENGD